MNSYKLDRSNKVLFLSWAIPPDKSGTSFLIRSIMENYNRDDFIWAGEKSVQYVDEQNLWRDKVYYISNDFNWRHKGKRFIRNFHWFFVPLYYLKLKDVIFKENIKKIVVVFPNEIYLLLSVLININLNIEIYPWFNNTYVENRKGISRIFGKIIQNFLFSKSKKIFCISDGLTLYYKKAYESLAAKFFTLQHGFRINKIKTPSKLLKKEKIELGIIGTINESCRDATVKFIQSITNNQNIRIHIISPTPLIYLKKIINLSNNVILHGFLSVHEKENLLNNLDGTVLCHGFHGKLSDIEYQTIFPTRTVDLLFLNKPIFAVVPENSFISQFLKDTDSAFVFNEKDLTGIGCIISEKTFSTESYQKCQNARLISEYFNVKKVIEKLILMINE